MSDQDGGQAAAHDEFTFSASTFFDFEEEDLPQENADGYFAKRRSSMFSGRHSLESQSAAKDAGEGQEGGPEGADSESNVAQPGVEPRHTVQAEPTPPPPAESEAHASAKGDDPGESAGDSAPAPGEAGDTGSNSDVAAAAADDVDLVVAGTSVDVRRHSDMLAASVGAEGAGREPAPARPSTPPPSRAGAERLSFSAPRRGQSSSDTHLDTASTTTSIPADAQSLASVEGDSVVMAPPPPPSGATAAPAMHPPKLAVRSTAASRARAAAAARRASASGQDAAQSPANASRGRFRRPSAPGHATAAAAGAPANEPPSTPTGRQPRYMQGTSASRSRSRTRVRPGAPDAEVVAGGADASPAGFRSRSRSSSRSRSRTPSQQRPASRARSRPGSRAAAGGTPSFMRPTSAWSSRGQEVEEETRRKQEAQEREQAALRATPTRLTEPQSPQFRYRPREEEGERMSSTTRELERIRREREELEAQREQAKRAFRAALQPKPNAGAPARSTQALTVPQEFAFRTGARPRASQAEALKKEADAPPPQRSTLAEGGAAAGAAALTAPQPFRFHTDARAASRSHDRPAPPADAAAAYVSMAEGVQSFSRTPKRFHTRSRAEDRPEPPAPGEPRLTEPQPFAFRTDARVGRATAEAAKSLEEREEEFMKSLKPFKARPVDPRVLGSSGDVGVPRLQKQLLTEPVEFKFHATGSARRPGVKSQEELDAEEMNKQFKARPWNPDAYSQTAAAATRPQPELTEARSPQLATKARAEVARAHKSLVSEGESTVSAKSSAKRVAPEGPFQLRSLERHEQARADFERRQAEERRAAEEAMRFKARPVPEYVAHPAPLTASVERRSLTEPDYDGPSHERHTEAMRRFEEQLRREAEEKAKQAAFHARPAPSSLHHPSFVPKRSMRPLTEAAPFSLYSDRRAEERSEFEEKQRQREAELARMKDEQELERKKQEEEEVQKLRKQMSFKARPVPRLGAFVPRPSNKPLTNPAEPKLGAPRRASTQPGTAAAQL